MYDIMQNMGMLSPIHPFFHNRMHGAPGIDMLFPPHHAHLSYPQNGFPHLLPPFSAAAVNAGALAFVPPPGTHQSDFVNHDPRIKVNLENSEVWDEFNQFTTEMIVTKHGRRMFPTLHISLSDLEKDTKYFVFVDLYPADENRYKYHGKEWIVAGKAEPQIPGRLFVHTDSPQTGSQWMRNPISFQKLKLTNNNMDTIGHMVLSSMHKYIPRIHIVPASNMAHVNCFSPANSFTFQETIFIAVTAYQNDLIKQLKIQHNPFAKGFRDTGMMRSKKKMNDSLQSDRDRSPPPGLKSIDELPSRRRRITSESSDVPAGSDTLDREDRPFPYRNFEKEFPEEDEELDEKIDVENILTPAPSMSDHINSVSSPSPDQFKQTQLESSEPVYHSIPLSPISPVAAETHCLKGPVAVPSSRPVHQDLPYGHFSFHSPFGTRDQSSQHFSSPLHHPYLTKPSNIMGSHILDRHFVTHMHSAFEKAPSATDFYSLLSNNSNLYPNKIPGYASIAPARPSPIHPYFSYPNPLPIL